MSLVLPLLAPLMVASILMPQSHPQPRVANVANLNKPANCRGRIEAVREALGLPKLQRDSASPDAQVLILAVDKQVDGCEVLVMKNNARDIRPLPEYSDGPARMIP